jgi:hypothetical protein
MMKAEKHRNTPALMAAPTPAKIVGQSAPRGTAMVGRTDGLGVVVM